MKKWLKFIGLSFFSDKISKEAVKRGYGNLIIGFIATIIFLLCGVLAADILPFGTHYNNSQDFKTLVHNSLNGTVNLEIKEGKAVCGEVIDTFSDGSQANKYAVNGYNVVIDTRSADALDDFEAYYLSNDGKEQKISLEEYSGLSDVAKRNFDFKISYTSHELILTDELIRSYESYLGETNNADYSQLKSNKNELSAEEYRSRVYVLYVNEYYPDLKAYENTGSVPLLRNYYYHNYVNSGAEKYLFIFDDSVVGEFETNGGLKVTFYGFYNNLTDGAIGGTEQAADDFVKNVFKATTSLSVYVYVMNLFRLLPFIILMPVILALIAYCIFRLIKAEWCQKFGGCMKIVSSYLLFGSLIAALITFLSGYFLPRGNILMASLVIFFIVMLVRTVVLIIKEWLSAKKAAEVESSNTETTYDPFSEDVK